MNIFEQYGIKEVADVTLYAIELDENDDEMYIPVLYMDTLKVSTVEQTAEQTSATGGRGNADLITWDYGKEITVTLEDALFTPASMGMIWGGVHDKYPIVIKATKSWAPKCCNGINDNDYTYDYTSNLTGPFNNIFNKTTEKWPDSDNEVSIYVTRVNQLIMLDANGGQAINADDLVTVDFTVIDKFLCYGEGFIESDYPDMRGYKKFKYDSSNNRIEVFLDCEREIYDVDIDKVQTITYDLETKVKYKSFYDLYKGNTYQYNLDDTEYLERMEKCIATETFCIDTDINNYHSHCRNNKRYNNCELTVFIDPKTMDVYEPNANSFQRKVRGNNLNNYYSVQEQTVSGNLHVIKQYEVYYKWTRTKAPTHESLGTQITVDAFHFPGTFKLVGETYVRDRINGKDQRYQFEIPLCKMSSETSLNLEAEGDPTTFSMSLKVLRKEDGTMMKLTQYKVNHNYYDKIQSASNKVVPIEKINDEDET
jgi:hypothetical protein